MGERSKKPDHELVIWCMERPWEAAWEIEDLRTSVIAFGAPWAVEHAQMLRLPSGHLHPTHYDILKRAGARMDDFVRAEIATPPPAGEGRGDG